VRQPLLTEPPQLAQVANLQTEGETAGRDGHPLTISGRCL
jgi:hypothetical protein